MNDFERRLQKMETSSAGGPVGLTVVKLGPVKRGKGGRVYRLGDNGQEYPAYAISELVYFGDSLVKLVGTGVETPGHCSLDDL